MRNVVEAAEEIRKKCIDYQEQLQGLARGPLAGCFGTIYNQSVLVLELLSHYYDVWRRVQVQGISSEEQERIRDENAQRVIMVTKWQFVDTISSIEYAAKEFTKNRSEFLDTQTNGRTYLKKVLRKSCELDSPFLNKNRFEEWCCLIEIRNIMVHNNGYADKNEDCSVGPLRINFRSNIMLKGKLAFFLELTSSAVDLFYSWSELALKKELSS